MIGSYVSVHEFFTRIYRFGESIDDKSHICVIDKYKMRAKWFRDIDSFLQYIEEENEKDIYHRFAHHYIPNTFVNWFQDRSEPSLRHERVMGFDFEEQKEDGTTYTHEEVAQLFADAGFPPAFVVSSKTPGHYHVYLFLSQMTGHKKSVKFFKQLQSMIAKKVGCQNLAEGPVHPFAIPFDRRIWMAWNIVEISVADLKDEFSEYCDENQEYKKVVSISTTRVLKHEAVQKLLNCELAPGESRNHAALTIALLYYALDIPKKEAEKLLSEGGEWYRKAQAFKSAKFYPSEVKRAVNKAYSKRFSGAHPKWVTRLTGVPFAYRVSKGTYKRKTNQKTKNENRQAIVEFLREAGGQVSMLQKDLIGALVEQGYKGASIKRNLQLLKEEGVVTYEVKKGGNTRGQATVFCLHDQLDEVRQEAKKEVSETKDNKTNALNHINEIKRMINQYRVVGSHVLESSSADHFAKGSLLHNTSRGAGGAPEEKYVVDSVEYLFWADGSGEVAATSDGSPSFRYEDIFDDDPFD